MIRVGFRAVEPAMAEMGRKQERIMVNMPPKINIDHLYSDGQLIPKSVAGPSTGDPVWFTGSVLSV